MNEKIPPKPIAAAYATADPQDLARRFNPHKMAAIIDLGT